MRKPTKHSLTRKLDHLWAEIIRSRGECAWCKTTSGLEAAHIFSRRYRAVRWDLLNGVLLCHKHHFYAHANPVLFAEFVKSYLGEYNYEKLKKSAQMTTNWTITDLEEIYANLLRIKNPGQRENDD